MKRLFFFLPTILLVVLVIGCSKDDDNDPSAEAFLACKLNGEFHKFNSGTNANQPPQEEIVHFVTVAGHETDDLLSPSFGISLVSEENVTAGTYHVGEGLHPELDGQYCIQLFDGNTHVGTECYIGGRGSETYFTLNIISIDRWGVKGTFSGRLKRSGGDGFIEVTDGQFSAPYNY